MKARVVSAVGVALLGSVALVVVTNRSILRVCADPNNLPFSNDRLEGFDRRTHLIRTTARVTCSFGSTIAICSSAHSTIPN